MGSWIHVLLAGVLWAAPLCSGCVVDLQSWGHGDTDVTQHVSLASLDGRQVKSSTRTGLLVGMVDVAACGLEGLEFDLFDTADRAQKMMDSYRSLHPDNVLLAITGDKVYNEANELEMVQMLSSYFGLPSFTYDSDDVTGVSFAIGSHVRQFSNTGEGPTKLSFNIRGASGYYCKLQTERYINIFLEELTTRSKIECAHFCLMSDTCLNFAYIGREGSSLAFGGQCILYGDPSFTDASSSSFKQAMVTCSETDHVIR